VRVQQNYVQIASSIDSSAALLANGTLLTWGYNACGQLGNGGTSNNYTPTAVGPSPNLYSSVAVGDCFMLALDIAGDVLAWGDNSAGELGTGNQNSALSPAIVPTLPSPPMQFIQVAAGDRTAYALRADGTIWAWGDNSTGALGINSTASFVATATQVMGLTNVVSISAGVSHALALRSDGTVYSWGDNSHGELGFSGSSQPAPVEVTSLPLPAKAINAGYYTSAVILGDGTVRDWGLNQWGGLGNGTSGVDSTSPVQPSLGNVTAVGLSSGVGDIAAGLSDGTVRTWGYNAFGELGNGSTTNSAVPVNPGVGGVAVLSTGALAESTFALAPAGGVATWGFNQNGNLGNGSTAASSYPTYPGLTGVKSVSVGCYHTLALMADGTVRAWGWNGYGQIGDSTTIDKSSPVSVAGLTNIIAVGAGGKHSLAVAGDGTVYGWGDGSSGQLGTGGTSSSASPVHLTSIHNAVAVVAGASHSLVQLADGTMLAFGDNSYGQLGTVSGSTLSPNPVAINNVKAIGAGAGHSYAVLADGTVATWGDNQIGELGVGDTSSHPGIQIVPNLSFVRDLSSNACSEQTVTIAALGSAVLWGSNSSGQLGNYNTEYPATVSTPGSIYGAYEYTRSVGSGYINTSIVDWAGNVWIVGDDAYGEFGNGSTGSSSNLINEVSNIGPVTTIAGGVDFIVALTQ
jgi:alpha-tubulin suppressor-like RCC1 family protein